MRTPAFFLFLTLNLLTVNPPAFSQTQTLHSGEDISLRGLSASDGGKILWATGNKGTILRSPDSGKTWLNLHIDNTDAQDFRGIRAFGPDVAYVFSVGNDGKSHIYKTSDAGKSWRIQYSDPRPAFFLDGLVCRSEKDCFAISDPIDGKFPILHTEDGEDWTELPKETEPAALPTEGIFAASNSSLILCGPKNADIFFATGGPAARVFRSTDNAHSWTAATTPILSGSPSAGIFSIACHDRTVVAVGGDYRNPTATKSVAAYSVDLGSSWHLADQPPAGYRSAVISAPSKISTTWVAVGATGVDMSNDSGVHWHLASHSDTNAVIAIGRDLVLFAGPKGIIGEMRIIKDLWR